MTTRHLIPLFVLFFLSWVTPIALNTTPFTAANNNTPGITVADGWNDPIG
ncbi:MAG: hypothetical protein AAF614_43915 [Chloroflexota bacterium]